MSSCKEMILAAMLLVLLLLPQGTRGVAFAHGTNPLSCQLAILAILCSSHDTQGLATNFTAGIVPSAGPLNTVHTTIIGCAGSSMQNDSSAEVCSDSAAPDSALHAAVRPSEPDAAVIESSQTLLASAQPAEAAAADRGHDHQQDVAPEAQLCTSTAGHPEPEMQLQLELANTVAASTSQEPDKAQEVVPHAALYWTFDCTATMAFAPCNISAVYIQYHCISSKYLCVCKRASNQPYMVQVMA